MEFRGADMTVQVSEITRKKTEILRPGNRRRCEEKVKRKGGVDKTVSRNGSDVRMRASKTVRERTEGVGRRREVRTVIANGAGGARAWVMGSTVRRRRRVDRQGTERKT